jgi:tetratricopeptide (TPR) repeat protein
MSDFIRHFSPQRSRPEDLEKILVQRETLLSDSVEKLRSSVLTPAKHHLLFVGPRGSGKTNMVALIQHRLSNQTDLGDRLRVAWLNEDETSTTFLKFLIRIYRALAARYPTEFTLSIQADVLGRTQAEALAILSEALLRQLGGRTCIVLVENLDALFDVMSEGELRTWRAFVQDHAVIATVGTAQRLFAGVSRREHPFFGFFDTHHLPPLSSEDARDLLKKLTLLGQIDKGKEELLAYLDSPKGRARLGAIHHLTGGSPRLYLILADFLTRETLDALVPAFEKMVDQQLTPYYQERMRWLSTQQREIVEYLCQARHPIVPVKTIAEALFAEHSTIASQLKKLKDMGYVVARPRGREVYYELAEPLMRLSFQVKEAAENGEKGPAPLRLVVDMLRIWFEQKQLEESVAHLPPQDAGRRYLEAALSDMKADGTNLCAEILRQSLGEANWESCTEEEFLKMEALAAISDGKVDLLKYMGACVFKGKHPEIIQAVTRFIDVYENSERITPHLYIVRALSFLEIEEWSDALADLTIAAEYSSLTDQEKALLFLKRGEAFEHLDQLDRAIGDYSSAIELPEEPNPLVAWTLFKRSILYNKQELMDKALADLDKVIRISSASAEITFLARTFKIIILFAEENHMECFAEIIHLAAFESEKAKFFFKVPGPEVMCGALVVSVAALDMTAARQRALRSCIKGWSRFGLLPQLGNSLVSHLEALLLSKLNSAGLDAWHALWAKAGDGYPELEIPLRMLKTGVAYIKTKEEGELLTLPQEERRILRQALKLPDET